MTDKAHQQVKKIILFSSFLSLFLVLATGASLSQPKAIEEKGPDIRFGEITFQTRDLESVVPPLKMLEVHIEVINKSQRITAPPNSIKVVVVPKEIKYPQGVSAAEFRLTQEETTLAVTLPPHTGRIFVFGFSLPEKKPESIVFEIQINPPEGEKKEIKWEGN